MIHIWSAAGCRRAPRPLSTDAMSLQVAGSGATTGASIRPKRARASQGSTTTSITTRGEHGFVAAANRCPYGSAAWLERVATPARVKTVHSVETDRVCVEDDSRSQARRESGSPTLERGGLPPLRPAPRGSIGPPSRVGRGSKLPRSRLGQQQKSPSARPGAGSWRRGFKVPVSSRSVRTFASSAYWMKASWLTGCCLKGIGSLLPAGVTILAKTVPSIELLMNRTEPSQKA